VPIGMSDFGESVDPAASTEGALRLRARAARTGDIAVLHRAVTLLDRVLRATPPENPNHGVAVLNLAGTLVMAFELTAKVEALDRAVALLQELDASPSDGSLTRVAWLPTLGWALMRRAERTGSLAVMQEAVAVRREALRPLCVRIR
jgi:cystathionine beta-lyase/cystathionine gamma-synthase